MNKVQRRVVWLASLLLVVAALTAITALPGTHTTTTFAHDSRHRTPTPTPTTPTPTPTIPPLVIDTTSLPDGLTMASFYGVQSTIISGTPTKLQTTTFTVQVKDNTGVATQALSITIDPPPLLVITSPTPPPATVGTSYFTNLFASGGVQPYTWSITAGQLPPGLALVKGSNGGTTISGTPTTKGTFTFTETVTDSTGAQASQQFSITVN
jgi:hypothetical protein